MAKKKFNFNPDTGDFFDEEFDDFSIMEGGDFDYDGDDDYDDDERR